jgi:hypothetical protein
MKVDLFAFTQGDTRTISFMSQALGLMAEADTGTDNWRWMGDTRFFLGFLRGRKAFHWVSSAMARLLKAILLSHCFQELPRHLTNQSCRTGQIQDSGGFTIKALWKDNRRSINFRK